MNRVPVSQPCPNRVPDTPAKPCPRVPPYKGTRFTDAEGTKKMLQPCPELFQPAEALNEPRTEPPAARPTADSLRHAAEQMAKIKKAGWITGPSDPDAATFAAAFELFEATPELSTAP